VEEDLVMEEMVDIVDENDNVIGKTSWDEAVKNKLLRRSVRVFILNSKGEMLLQKRSKKVKIHPGLWTSASTGSVTSGEKYEEIAQRELLEEVGIETKLNFLFKIRQSDSICAAFEGFYDGKIKSNWEVEKIEFVKIDKIKEEIENNSRNFTNGFKESFKKYLELKGIR
jgi:isopentenyldiphosphate isomerase